MDEMSFARAGGPSLQSLGIVSPGDAFGDAMRLGGLIKKEIFDNKDMYINLAIGLERKSVAHIDFHLLASAMCSVAAYQVVVKEGFE